MKKVRQDGHEIWRAVTRTVRPLRPTVQAPVVAPPRAAPPARTVVQPHTAAPPATPIKRPVATLADRSPEKRVRRGRVEIGGKLDLHGMTQAEARAALARFVGHQRDEGARCVLVVTGKGRGEEGGVLRAALPGWLAGLRPTVTSYAQAHQKHGGGGAWYVFLKAGAEP